MKQQALHITFHNPNTEEETARYLAKIIARDLADRILRDKTVFSSGSGSEEPA